ncbi:uncharacterized protein LOC113383608 [Ctenocephalides felis]|uniref:uncharacterized protein LOC113383608 n=1 Tax=Ctenocephalides felis TaxID=7515 RepID=UPI000E6E4745|nr:uncharacterized protein LOC113383608 [Ctenocephalides felis]
MLLPQCTLYLITISCILINTDAAALAEPEIQPVFELSTDTILEGAATAIKALQPILVQQKGFSGPRFRRSAEEESDISPDPSPDQSPDPSPDQKSVDSSRDDEGYTWLIVPWTTFMESVPNRIISDDELRNLLTKWPVVIIQLTDSFDIFPPLDVSLDTLEYFLNMAGLTGGPLNPINIALKGLRKGIQGVQTLSDNISNNPFF